MFDFVRSHTRLFQGILVLLVFPSFVFFGVQGYSSFTDAANCDLTNASAKVAPTPITSPVDFISGDKTGSTPGKRANGKTASLTEK